MTLDLQLLLAVCTWPCCAWIVFVSVCRLNAMGDHVLARVRLEYGIYNAIAVGVFLAPLADQWPGYLGFGVVLGLAVALTCSWKAWAGDVAPAEASDHAPLSERRATDP